MTVQKISVTDLLSAAKFALLTAFCGAGLFRRLTSIRGGE